MFDQFTLAYEAEFGITNIVGHPSSIFGTIGNFQILKSSNSSSESKECVDFFASSTKNYERWILILQACFSWFAVSIQPKFDTSGWNYVP